MSITTSPLDRKVQFAFGSAILALLAVGALSYRVMVVSSESDRWVRHTHEVLASLQDLRFALESVESSVRGVRIDRRRILSCDLPYQPGEDRREPGRG